MLLMTWLAGASDSCVTSARARKVGLAVVGGGDRCVAHTRIRSCCSALCACAVWGKPAVESGGAAAFLEESPSEEYDGQENTLQAGCCCAPASSTQQWSWSFLVPLCTMAARSLPLLLLCACLAGAASAQRTQSALFGDLFGSVQGVPAAAPAAARRVPAGQARATVPPAPRAGAAPTEVGTLQFIGINIHNDRAYTAIFAMCASQRGCDAVADTDVRARADKVVRTPLITMDVAVEKAPPVVVEMPNGAHAHTHAHARARAR
jgi:hypothetical protein